MSRLAVDSGQVLAEPKSNAEIVFKGRNVEIPDHFRIYVSQKLARLERFDRTIYLFDVELDHERNRRQRKSCQRVEITARGRGPVVRGEACADSFYAALESAVVKLESRLRRGKDRRKVHYGDKTPVSLAEATAVVPAPENGFNTRPAEAHDHDGAVVEREPGGSFAPKNTRPSRCRSMTRSTRWSWLDTTSSCSTTRTPNGRRWSTAGTPTTTA